MTLAEADEIFRYWQRNPPPHLMLQAIARLIGWAPPPPAALSLEAIAAAAPPGLAVMRVGGLDMPVPILDAAALAVRNRDCAIAIAHRNRDDAAS